MEATMRIALLIDADNASAATLDHVLSEIADLGVANVRRAYGDWANPSLRSWREALLSNAIQPIQQVAYTIKPLIVATGLFEVRNDGNHIRTKPELAK